MPSATVCAVVTGGGRGIGAAVAHRLAARGLRVVLAARTDEQVQAVARAICAEHGPEVALAARCDVGRAGDVARLAELAASFCDGGVGILVNNAGTVARALAHEMNEGTWDGVIESNLKSTWLCTRAFLPAMLARATGRIVNVASISATLGTPRASAYCAAKWGVVGFTKSVAEEVRDRGVQVMAVLPGSVDTAMLVGSGFEPRMSADDVARTIEYLALDAPAAMTASAVEVFG